MPLIDTHSHIYLPQFDEDLDEMIKRAKAAGVSKIFLPNIDLESVPRMLSLTEKYPDVCFPMLGLHPCDVKENYKAVLDTMRAMFERGNFIAVGEIGIDLYWDKTTLDIQIEAFKMQCVWAKEMGLPIVIHARDSFDEIFTVMDEIHDDSLFGVFHCFTGNAQQAQKVMSYGNFLMGIGGVLTYEKSGLDAVAKDLPMEYLVLETDSPFLTPKPFRGKRNESSYVKLVAERLAAVKGISYNEVIEITGQNALQLFKLN